MSLIAIAVFGAKKVIGRKGEKPYGKIPLDMSFFRQTTKGKTFQMNTVVVGSRTFYAIGKPLPGRRTIVLTHHPREIQERFGGTVCTSNNIGEVVELSKERDVYILGGQSVFEQFMSRPELRTLYITHVHDNLPGPRGDKFFPHFSEEDGWKKIKTEFHAPSPQNTHALSFEIWIRK